MHGGDVAWSGAWYRTTLDLATARFSARGGSGTALHFVTDWPGYFPNGPDIVNLLVDAGADPNATPPVPESPRRLCTTPRAATTSMSPPHLLTEARISKHLEAPSAPLGQCHRLCVLARRSPLGDAGRPNRKVWHAAALGMLDTLETCWCQGSTEKRSQRASGTRAALANAVPQSACLMRVPISTGSPTMQKVRRWMPLMVLGLDKGMLSSGCGPSAHAQASPRTNNRNQTERQVQKTRNSIVTSGNPCCF